MNLAFPSLQSNSVSPIASCKAALFKIADHWFALPATTILKIIPATALETGTTSQLTVWDNHPLVRLDLHQLLMRTVAHSSQPDDSSSNSHQYISHQQASHQQASHQQASHQQASGRYVMIVWAQTGERCGIFVDELPALHELSLSEAQVLPPHYRQSIGNIAKYLVIQPHQGTVLNILLLDLQQALHRAVGMAADGVRQRIE
jgi:hypothetical protein